MNLFDILYPYQKRFVEDRRRRKLWISSRQIGKSFTLSALLVQRALEKGPQGLSLCVSTGQRAASEITRKCAQWAEAVQMATGGQIRFSQGADKIEFSTGARVLSLPNNPGALRGFTAQTVAVDEAAFVEGFADVMQAIAPTLTRDPNAQLVVASTPAGMNGPFYEMYEKALRDPEWLVQTTTIWDAKADGLQVDVEALKSLCPDPDVFAQEYECSFQSEFSAFLDDSLLKFEDLSEECQGRACFLGYDVARTTDFACMVDLVHLKDGRFFVRDCDMTRGLKYAEQARRVARAHQLRKFVSGYVDATGMGGPVAEQLHDEVSPLIRPFVFTASSKPPLFERLRALAVDGRLVFRPGLEEQVRDDVRAVKRVVTPEGKIKFQAERSDKGHADLVSALVLALAAWNDMPASFGDPQTAPYTGRFGERADVLGPRFSRLAPPF